MSRKVKKETKEKRSGNVRARYCIIVRHMPHETRYSINKWTCALLLLIKPIARPTASHDNAFHADYALARVCGLARPSLAFANTAIAAAPAVDYILRPSRLPVLTFFPG